MEISNIFKINNGFNQQYREKKNRLPYHINLLDELRFDENAHSRILLKLLSYKEDNNYPFLQSFLKYLGCDFAKIKLRNARLINEKHRIDLLVIDKKEGIGIILENKIHGAIDQPKQILNYIERLRLNERIDYEGIFVLYLTRNGDNPSLNSFPDSLKDLFKNRFIPISYRSHVLNWLKEKVLPVIKYKDIFLLSAVQQYIDHLEGMFNFRKIEKKMKEELQSWLTNELFKENNISTEDKITLLKEKQNDAQRLLSHLKQIQIKIIQECFSNWEAAIKSKFPEKEIFSNSGNIKKEKEKYFYLGIKHKLSNGDEILIGIGKDDTSDEKPYYGITKRGFAAKEKNDNTISLVNNNFNTDVYKQTTNWYYWKQADFDIIIDEYFTFYERVRKNIS